MDKRYQALQQAVSSAFLAKPDLIYTAALVASEKLQTLLLEALNRLLNLRKYLRQSVRFVDPVRSITPLQNAAQAALDLESAKVSHLQPLSSQPAYQRFRAQTLAYLKVHLPESVVAGEVVEAPAESRLKAAQEWVNFLAAWPALLEGVRGVSLTSSSFAAAKLPEAASSLTRTRVRQQMSLLHSRLASQTPEERLATAKQDMLQILAARAALESLSSLPSTSRFYKITTPSVFSADADHPGTSPQLVASSEGPYELTLPLDLYTEIPGSSPKKVVLPVSTNPSFEGVFPETYASVTEVVGAPGPFTFDANNNELQVFLIDANGQPLDGSVVLAEGVGRTAIQLALEIEGVWAAKGISLVSFSADRVGSALRLRAFGGARLAVGSGTANGPLGLPSHGGFEITDTAPASLLAPTPGPYLVVTGVSDSLLLTFRDPDTGSYVSISKVLSPGSKTAAVLASYIHNVMVDAGVHMDYVAFDDGGTLHLISPTGSKYEISVGNGSINNLLGFTNGQRSVGTDRNSELVVRLSGVALPTFTAPYGKISARTLASALQSHLGADWQVLENGPYTQQRVALRYVSTGAASTYISVNTSKLADMMGWLQGTKAYGQLLTASDLAKSINKSAEDIVASSRLVQTGMTTAYTTSDPSQLRLVKERGRADISSPAPLSLLMVVSGSTLQAGHLIRLSDGSFWTVASVTSTQVTATGTTTLPAPVLQAIYEAGPAPPVAPGTAISVATGPLQGVYSVVALVDPLTVSLRELVPSIPGGNPFSGAAVIGLEYLTLDTKTPSDLTLSGPGCTRLFGVTPKAKTQQTSWLLLGEDVRPSPEVGDTVLLQQSGTTTLTILQVSGRWLKLSSARDVGSTWGYRQPAPYLQIQNARQVRLDALEATCGYFLASRYVQKPYLDNLSQTLHQVTATPSNSLPRLQAALSALDPLTEVVDALIADLKEYQVRRDATFEQLLRTLKEQGSDYAVELLSSCRFEEFFALEPSESSYVGALASSLRKFTASNLPISATEVAQRKRLVSSSQGPDPEQVFEEEDQPRGLESRGSPVVSTLNLKE